MEGTCESEMQGSSLHIIILEYDFDGRKSSD